MCLSAGKKMTRREIKESALSGEAVGEFREWLCQRFQGFSVQQTYLARAKFSKPISEERLARLMEPPQDYARSSGTSLMDARAVTDHGWLRLEPAEQPEGLSLGNSLSVCDARRRPTTRWRLLAYLTRTRDLSAGASPRPAARSTTATFKDRTCARSSARELLASEQPRGEHRNGAIPAPKRRTGSHLLPPPRIRHRRFSKSFHCPDLHHHASHPHHQHRHSRIVPMPSRTAHTSSPRPLFSARGVALLRLLALPEPSPLAPTRASVRDPSLAKERGRGSDVRGEHRRITKSTSAVAKAEDSRSWTHSTSSRVLLARAGRTHPPAQSPCIPVRRKRAGGQILLARRTSGVTLEQADAADLEHPCVLPSLPLLFPVLTTSPEAPGVQNSDARRVTCVLAPEEYKAAMDGQALGLDAGPPTAGARKTAYGFPLPTSSASYSPRIPPLTQERRATERTIAVPARERVLCKESVSCAQGERAVAARYPVSPPPPPPSALRLDSERTSTCAFLPPSPSPAPRSPLLPRSPSSGLSNTPAPAPTARQSRGWRTRETLETAPNERRGWVMREEERAREGPECATGDEALAGKEATRRL
ncbi:hypothetical protein DFH09DRAFT_1463065 [Mycena vulgaris]|nr:hypothetical protein DFH09DRAFT_1463065 [Mycena vulgaris]